MAFPHVLPILVGSPPLPSHLCNSTNTLYGQTRPLDKTILPPRFRSSSMPDAPPPSFPNAPRAYVSHRSLLGLRLAQFYYSNFLLHLSFGPLLTCPFLRSPPPKLSASHSFVLLKLLCTAFSSIGHVDPKPTRRPPYFRDKLSCIFISTFCLLFDTPFNILPTRHSLYMILFCVIRIPVQSLSSQTVSYPARAPPPRQSRN